MARFLSEAKLYKFLKEKTVAEDVVISVNRWGTNSITGYDRYINLPNPKSLFTIKVTATEEEVMKLLDKWGA